MATKPSVALRLGMEGGEAIERGLEAIGASGSASAKRMAADFQRASEDVDAAIARATKAGQRVASFSPTVASAPANQPSTDLFRAYQREQSDLTRQAEALRNAIDPLRVAQAAYDREVEIANGLLRANRITQTEHAAAVKLSTDALARASAEQVRGAANDNLRRSALQNLSFQVQDVGAQLSTVSGPSGLFRIFAQQGGQVFAALNDIARSGGNASGGIKQTGEASQEAGADLAGIGEKAVGVAEKVERTGGKFAAVAGFLAGPWGAALLVGTTLLAPLIGKLFETDDAAEKAAREGLADFQKRQQDMARFIDATTGKLIEQNRQLALLQQRQFPTLIGGKGVESQGYIDAAFAAVRDRVREGGRGGNPQLLEVLRSSGGNVATLDRLLGTVAKTTPAYRELAASVSGYRGRAIEAFQAGRQLEGQQRDLNTVLAGGRVVSSQTVQDLVARRTATGQVAAARQRLSDVEARGAAIDRMTSGDAKDRALKEYEGDLTRATRAVQAAKQAEQGARTTRQALTKDTREAARATQELDEAIRRLVDQGDPEGAATRTYRTTVANIEKRKAAGFITPEEAAIAGEEASRAYGKALAQARETYRSEHPPLVDLNATLLGGVDVGEEAKRGAERVAAFLRPAKDGLAELRASGAKLVDDVFNPSNWQDWGSAGKGVLKEVENAMLRLALINPLKNLISGDNKAPTLLSTVGKLASIFGGAKSPSPNFAIDGFASGTDYAPGGLAWVAENGPELIRLPRGASVTPAPQTRAMLGAANDRGGMTINVDARGANDPAAVEAAVQRGIAAAAPQIALGGAQLAEARATRRQRYRIPGR